MFTRQHYKAIAEILNKALDEKPDNAHRYIRLELQAYFASDNPNFDPDRFQYACLKN